MTGWEREQVDYLVWYLPLECYHLTGKTLLVWEDIKPCYIRMQLEDYCMSHSSHIYSLSQISNVRRIKRGWDGLESLG